MDLTDALRWSPDEVGAFLESNGMAKYRDEFILQGIDGATLLHHVTREDLHLELRIRNLLDRKRIWAAVEQLREMNNVAVTEDSSAGRSPTRVDPLASAGQFNTPPKGSSPTLKGNKSPLRNITAANSPYSSTGSLGIYGSALYGRGKPGWVSALHAPSSALRVPPPPSGALSPTIVTTTKTSLDSKIPPRPSSAPPSRKLEKVVPPTPEKADKPAVAVRQAAKPDEDLGIQNVESAGHTPSQTPPTHTRSPTRDADLNEGDAVVESEASPDPFVVTELSNHLPRTTRAAVSLPTTPATTDSGATLTKVDSFDPEERRRHTENHHMISVDRGLVIVDQQVEQAYEGFSVDSGEMREILRRKDSACAGRIDCPQFSRRLRQSLCADSVLAPPQTLQEYQSKRRSTSPPTREVLTMSCLDPSKDEGETFAPRTLVTDLATSKAWYRHQRPSSAPLGRRSFDSTMPGSPATGEKTNYSELLKEQHRQHEQLKAKDDNYRKVMQAYEEIQRTIKHNMEVLVSSERLLALDAFQNPSRVASMQALKQAIVSGPSSVVPADGGEDVAKDRSH
eukprot:PhM_4_TR5611/c0_g1_i1/m.4017